MELEQQPWLLTMDWARKGCEGDGVWKWDKGNVNGGERIQLKVKQANISVQWRSGGFRLQAGTAGCPCQT